MVFGKGLLYTVPLSPTVRRPFPLAQLLKQPSSIRLVTFLCESSLHKIIELLRAHIGDVMFVTTAVKMHMVAYHMILQLAPVFAETPIGGDRPF